MKNKLGRTLSKLNTSICTVKHRQEEFPVWADLLKVRELHLQGRTIDTRNGQNTLFQKDTLLYPEHLCVKFQTM
jgi:hypothetical protein